jgi:hypothetical protein
VTIRGGTSEKGPLFIGKHVWGYTLKT